MAKGFRIPKVGGSGEGATNLVIGVITAGAVGYLAYSHFFNKEVGPTATAVAAAGEEMMNLRASTESCFT